MTNIIKRTRTMKADAMTRIFPKTTSKHFKVGTPSTTQLPQGSSCIYLINSGNLIGLVMPSPESAGKRIFSKTPTIAKTTKIRMIPIKAA